MSQADTRGDIVTKRREFEVVTGLPPDQFLARLSELSAEDWQVEAFETAAVPGSPGIYTALLSREARKSRRANGPDAD